MKNKIPVYLDFDNTIVDSTERLIFLLNQYYNTNKNYKDVKRYNCSDLFPNITQNLILDMFDKEEFFNDLSIFPNCKEVLLKYKENFDYQITTICTEKSLIHKKEYLNKELFPCIFTLNGIIKNGTGKEMIDMSNGIIIDDHIDNIRSSNAKYKILYKGELDTEWNQFEISDNCFVARNWEEVDVFLEDIIRKESL